MCCCGERPDGPGGPDLSAGAPPDLWRPLLRLLTEIGAHIK
ncbi:MAG: hypothetical protein ACLTYN_13025 [Dysosmobacter welbionis]